MTVWMKTSEKSPVFCKRMPTIWSLRMWLGASLARTVREETETMVVVCLRLAESLCMMKME